MPPIIAGNSLSDLSRNSLLREEMAANERAQIADEMLRRRAQNNEMARFGGDLGFRYAGLGQQGQQFNDDLVFRRDTLGQQGRQFDNELALRQNEFNNRWSKLTPYEQAALDNQLILAETANLGYPRGGIGEQIIKNDLRNKSDAEAAAAQANALLEAKQREVAEPILKGRMDSGADNSGWFGGMLSGNAKKASRFMLGIDPMAPWENFYDDNAARGTRDWYLTPSNQTHISNFSADQLLSQVPDVAGLVDKTTNNAGRVSFVPRFTPSAQLGGQGLSQRAIDIINEAKARRGMTNAPAVNLGGATNRFRVVQVQ